MPPDQVICPTCRAPQKTMVPGHRRVSRLLALGVVLTVAIALVVLSIFWWVR